MSDQHKPIITEHSPFFAPHIPLNQVREQQRSNREVALSASREESEREEAYLRSLNPPAAPNVQLPSVRQPVLPSDFAQAVDAFDDEILKRGVAVSRDRLVSLGKERFDKLLALDREARSVQRVVGCNTDFSNWFSVMQSFADAGALATSVPRRRTADVVAGRGLDRERASKIADFSDLWKTNQEPAIVRNVLRFRDCFESLVLAQSMLDQLQDDGRVRSHFFCGGKGERVRYFKHWLSALEKPHFSVTLIDSLGQLFVWLTNEKTGIPHTIDLAKDFFGVRAPSPQQLRFASAVWHGFVLDHRTWDLWDYVGNNTRAQADMNALETWRAQLSQRYRSITAFHDQLRAAFLKPVASRDAGHLQFDERAHRQFIDAQVRKLSNRLSSIVAMAIEETMPQSVVARFENWVLCEAADNDKATLDAKIFSKLQTAFPNSDFQFEIEGA